MNSDLGKEQHSSTAAEALSLLLGIRYSKNQIFEKLKKQDCSIFHDNIKLTSNDLYISIVNSGDARLAISSTKIFGCTTIIYEIKKEVREFNLRVIEKERLEHSIKCFPLDEKNVQFLKDKLQQFSSLGSNLVVHLCLNDQLVLEEFEQTIVEILKTGGRVITQHPIHFQNTTLMNKYLFSETVLYKFFGANPLSSNNINNNKNVNNGTSDKHKKIKKDAKSSERNNRIFIPRWRANSVSSKYSSNDLYRLCRIELDQVINYLSNHNVSNNNSSSSSNEQSFEKDVEIHNYVSNEHDIFLMRKKHLEKDLRVFEIANQLAYDEYNNSSENLEKGIKIKSHILSASNLIQSEWNNISKFRIVYNNDRINRTGIVFNHLQQYSNVSGNLECELAYRIYIAFKTIFHTYTFNNYGPLIINTPMKPISNDILNAINNHNNNTDNKNIKPSNVINEFNIFPSSYSNPNLITMEDLVANGTIELVDMIMEYKKFNGIVLNPPTSPVLKTLNMKKELWCDYCTNIVSRYVINKYPNKVKRILIINVHNSSKEIMKQERKRKMLLDSDAVLTININAYRKDQDVISTQNNINISMGNDTNHNNNNHTTIADYCYIWDRIVLPKARRFDPDMILFDTTIGCNINDYLSNLIHPLLGLANGRFILFLEQQPVMVKKEDNKNENVRKACKCIIKCLNIFDGWPPQRVGEISAVAQVKTRSIVEQILLELENNNDQSNKVIVNKLHEKKGNSINTTTIIEKMPPKTIQDFKKKNIEVNNDDDIVDEKEEEDHSHRIQLLHHDSDIELEHEVHV